MAKIKFSILIRGNNKAHWLKILLRKIKNQSLQNYEIVFCDNNSTDETLKVLKKFKVKKIVKIKKYFPGLALNMGIKKAKGKYIVIISSHCVPKDNDWLKEYFDFMNKNKNVVAGYGKQYSLPGTSVKDQLDLNIIFKDEEIISKNDTYFNNANAVYRSEYLRKNLFSNSVSNIEDRLWALKQSKKGKYIGYTAKSSVYHIDGVHQHKSTSERAKKSVDLLNRKYSKIWKNCEFLRPNFYNFIILVNGRRLQDPSELSQLKNLLKNNFFKKLNIQKIFIITKGKINKIKQKINMQVVKPKKNLGEDLKKIYLSNQKDWTDTNYIIYLNLKSNWNFKKLANLVNKACYNTVESITFSEKIFGNFEVIYKDGSIIKSNSLEERSQKPWIRILKWPQGTVLIPSILRSKLLVNNNTKHLYI